ncbi:MAG: UDP-2,3-diacylglucosamine diphosphatase [Candidatus Syntrophosphaera sp.]|nr:UDP-2,3-diacylglucosamine diphosphatase [Candidatus Syntrophosphaera sp.]
MRVCVISDIHYKFAPETEADLQNEELVLSFLRGAVGKYDLMVLNGDIFDLWFDWKYAMIKQYFPLLHRLAEIAENGCRLVLVSGNHDFWFGDFLSRYLGMEIHDDKFSLEADGKKMLFTHGDLHTVNDFRYKFFRRLVRFPATRKLFSLLHPDLALALGGKMSRSSRLREVSHILQSKKSSGLLRYAQSQIRRNKFDLVFMGHSHKPAIRELEGGTYVNSGDWIQNHSYVEIINGILHLEHYANKENQNETDPSQNGPDGHDPAAQPHPAELSDERG